MKLLAVTFTLLMLVFWNAGGCSDILIRCINISPMCEKNTEGNAYAFCGLVLIL